MEAREYLEQYKKLSWHIERLKRDIDDLEDSIDSISIDYNYRPRSNEISRRTENKAVKLATLKDKKQKEILESWEKREEIVDTISMIEDSILYQLLYDRYIKFMTWETISEDIGTSEYWTRSKLHNKALSALEKIIN
ncbi:MAG: hypothetical protein IJH62_08010 [Mogibacterium sp.]|nr:hypothetical protein [Mogibacterium sp.]